MKVLFDTSVLVAALIPDHAMHGRSFPWLRRAHEGELEFIVAAHSTLELYSVLTRLPVAPRIGPLTAKRLVSENVSGHARNVALSATDYRQLLERVAELGLAGGVVFDALVARSAEKSGAERLLTLNPSDFERVWPEGTETISLP